MTRAPESFKNLPFNVLCLTKIYVWAKKVQRSCLIVPKIDAKFQGKLNGIFKNDMIILANFHKLKNSDFFLGRQMAKLSQNENSEQ